MLHPSQVSGSVKVNKVECFNIPDWSLPYFSNSAPIVSKSSCSLIQKSVSFIFVLSVLLRCDDLLQILVLIVSGFKIMLWHHTHPTSNLLRNSLFLRAQFPVSVASHRDGSCSCWAEHKTGPGMGFVNLETHACPPTRPYFLIFYKEKLHTKCSNLSLWDILFEATTSCFLCILDNLVI